MAKSESPRTGLVNPGPLAYLLFLQGDRWAQHHLVLLERLFYLPRQQDQGLPGAQQDPDNKHKRNMVRFSPYLEKSTGPVCRGSGLGIVLLVRGRARAKRGQIGSATEEQKSQVELKLFRLVEEAIARSPLLYFSPFSRNTSRRPRMGNGLGQGVVDQKGDLWGRTTVRTDLKADTHSFSLGALFTFEASNARLTLNERKKSAHTGFSLPTPEIYCGEPGQEGTEKRDTWVGHGDHFRLLPSDLWGPEDQLHLGDQEDHGAQGNQGHQQFQEHPVSTSRREEREERR